MRKLLAVALVLVVGAFGVPSGIFAQGAAPARLATISGETVDAGGLAVVGQRVDLVREGVVVDSTNTGSRGEWSFTNVAPGDYVVRVIANGQVAGIRVSVVAGQTFANALIVTPGAAAPSALFGLGGLGTVLLIGGIAAGAIATTVVLVDGS